MRNWLQGRLEVFSGGGWRRAACTTDFGGREAAVACRQLGHGAGTVALSGVDDGFLLQDEPLAVDRPGDVVLPVGCDGSEERLADCSGLSNLADGERLGVLDLFCEGSLVLACVEQEARGVHNCVCIHAFRGH